MTTTANDFEPSCVVCALDFEQPVSGVLDTAISIAARFDATLHLVHAWLPAVALSPEGGMLPGANELDALATNLGDRLESTAAAVRLRHARVTTGLVPGTPWREIVRYAEQHDADLIIAGTHGRSGIARLLEGSVAERVVRTSSIPVLVVPIHHVDDPTRSKERPVMETEIEAEKEDVWIPEA